MSQVSWIVFVAVIALVFVIIFLAVGSFSSRSLHNLSCYMGGQYEELDMKSESENVP